MFSAFKMILDIKPNPLLYGKGMLHWSNLMFLGHYGLKLSDYDVRTYPPQKELYIKDNHPKLNEILMLIQKQGFIYTKHGEHTGHTGYTDHTSHTFSGNAVTKYPGTNGTVFDP